MGYMQWYLRHGKKHAEIMRRLEGLDESEVLEYFLYDNMLENEPDFCPLYRDGKKCHDIENLNCYLCACPYFRFDDAAIEKRDGKELRSLCSIDAVKSSFIEHDDVIHLDCSACLLPHKKAFIHRHFDRDWFEIMKESPPSGREE